MRRVVIYLIIGIFFGLIAYFLIHELSPFKMELLHELVESEGIAKGDFASLNSEIQNLIDRGLILSFLSENAYIVGFCILASIFFIFTAIHLVIDKVFFKNFYENPSHFDALRRGFLLVLSLALAVFAKLSRAEVYIILLIFIVAILGEVVFVMYFKDRKRTEDNLENGESNEFNSSDQHVGKDTSDKHISYEEFLESMERFGVRDKNTSNP